MHACNDNCLIRLSIAACVKIPMTLSGLEEPAAIFVIGIALVLVANTQFCGITASTSFITLCFMFKSSNTASITISALLKFL